MTSEQRSFRSGLYHRHRPPINGRLSSLSQMQQGRSVKLQRHLASRPATIFQLAASKGLSRKIRNRCPVCLQLPFPSQVPDHHYKYFPAYALIES